MTRIENDKRLASKEWRMSHLYQIKDKDGKVVTFSPNRAQLDYTGKRHYRNVILKSRQLGFTTFEVIDQFDDMMFTTKVLFDSLFIAHKKEDAEKIFAGKLKFAWDRLPEAIRNLYELKSNSAGVFRVNLGEGHENAVSVSMSARSGTYQRIHISELSYVDKNDPGKSGEIMSGAIPSLAFDSLLTIESTARGLSGNFYDIFMTAYKRDSDKPLARKEYKAHFYNWTWDDYELGKITDQMIEDSKGVIPDFIEDLAVKHSFTDREKTCYYYFYLGCNGDMDILRQEYPITVDEAFEGSVVGLFGIDQVNALREKKGRSEGSWVYFKDYIPGHVYGLGADVSEGIGRDASTIVIWDFTALYSNTGEKPEVVATYSDSKISPTEFAYPIMAGATRYGKCLVAPERNNHGHATIGQLRQIYPENLIFKVGMDVTSLKEAKEDRFGFLTTTMSKSIMLNEMNDAVNQEIVDVWSKSLKEEMKSYDKDDLATVRKKKDQTRHWDLLIAACIGWQMRRYVKSPKSEVTVYEELVTDPYE